ncbi:MAG: substrate binding domain-containing protein, partial [Pseudomonadota bacterium]
MRVIGSPKYLYEYGVPRRLEELAHHKLLHFSNQSSGNAWKITSPTGEKRLIRGGGSLTVNDGQSLLQAAEAGLGIAYLPSFLYHEALEDDRLKIVLPDLPVETLGIHVVYPPGLYTQPKLRAFIDFLAEHFRGKGPETW